MATDNPYADLMRNVASTRLSNGAVSKNLSRDQFRSTCRDRSPAPAQVSSVAPSIVQAEQENLGVGATDSDLTAVLEAQAIKSPQPKSSFSDLAARSKSSTGGYVAPPAARTSAAVATKVQAGGFGNRVDAAPPVQRAASAPMGFGKRVEGASEGPGPEDMPPADMQEPPDAAPAAGPVMGFGRGLQGLQRSTAPAAASSELTKIRLSDEQMAIVTCEDRIIVAEAFAGCAKTTTGIAYAAHRPNVRMLYLCLNAAVAEEAQRRFGPNVKAATTHSVAWNAIRPHKDRVTKRWNPMLVMDQMRMNSARTAMVTMKILAAYFNSGDVELSEKHAVAVANDHDLKDSEIGNGVAYASLAWKRMNDQGDSLQFPHDAYLKMFALRSPKLSEYQTIIFDEAQDANPVTMQIIRGQKHVKLLCIGDRHQAIYQFRGSVNAMEHFSIGATKLHLSQTWRFGPKIAGLANTLLAEFKGETVPIKGVAADGVWDPRRVTRLSRTNAELFRLAAPVRGEGVHWVGGKVNKFTGDWMDGCENYRLDGVIDAYHLYARERTQIKDKLMREKFGSWDDFTKYAEDAGDGEAKILVKVVEEFMDGVPDLVADIKKNAVRESKDADMTLTTAHRAKGLEWSCVQLSEDFEVLEGIETKLAQNANAVIPIQDINLLYVALTRAQQAVKLNKETEDWLKRLPEHRKAREAATTRLQGDLDRQRRQLQSLP